MGIQAVSREPNRSEKHVAHLSAFIRRQDNDKSGGDLYHEGIDNSSKRAIRPLKNDTTMM